MGLTIGLSSEIDGEIRRFLDSFYGKNIMEEEGVCRWEKVFVKPLDALDIICASIDNYENYHLETEILISEGQWYKINKNNINSVVKDMVLLFYKEAQVSANT